MKRNSYWRDPKQAGVGWWYANKGSIEVHCDAEHNKLHTTVKIRRKDLVEYLRRSAKK